MSVHYNLVGDSKGQTLTIIYSNGSIQPISSSHAEFTRILGYLVDTPNADIDEDRLRKMTDIAEAVTNRLTSLSERVAVRGGKVLFDGDEVGSAIADHILRLLQEDDEDGWRPLVNFLEKVATNPDEESRASLYSWLSANKFTLTTDGDFVAYKGVQIIDGVSHSINRGTAFVDGVEYTGYIPNPLGATVTMPRASVQIDRSVGCSTGLHAGTYEYAKDFSRARVVTVLINPRDVVSVPTDCYSQKLRVSRYVVSEETDDVYVIPTIDVSADEFVDDVDDDWDEVNGYYDEYEDDYEPEPEDEDDEEDDEGTIEYVVIDGQRYYREY